MKRKPIVGETLYDLNVGNAARGRDQTLTPVIVRAVGRKYFTCSSAEWPKQITQYRLETWEENTEYCRTHRLFSDSQEWLDEKEAAEIKGRMREIFVGYGTSKLSLEQLRAIEAIVLANNRGDT